MPRYFLILRLMPICPFSMALWKAHLRILPLMRTLMILLGFLAD